MGAANSKQHAVSGFVEEQIDSNQHATSPSKQNIFLSCPSLFCPPSNDEGPPKSLYGNDLQSRPDSRPQSHDDHNKFGTPIPDAVDYMRRFRVRHQKEEYYDDGEEKKMNGGSFSRCVEPGELRSSRYIGLEKEGYNMFSYEQSTIQEPLSLSRTRSCARIHDGKHAELEFYDKYEICEILGVGSTSTCHRCVEISSGESRACKIIDKAEIDAKYQTMMDQFYMEIETLRTLQHPNIIRLFDVYLTEDKIYIIMELMSGGELFDYVVQKGTLTEEEASRIVRKVTSALVYMHSKNVIHRDLKPENLLLTHKPRSSHDVEVKIIDFGLSKIMDDGPVASTFLGTRGYLAPEMIQRRQYTKSVDAWALGVIIFVLLCGCLPFDDDCKSVPSSPELREKFTLRFPRWAKDLSHSAKDLLNNLLTVDSNRRYSAEQALEHPWVRGETASKDCLLQSPGRMKPSSGSRNTSQATKDHVSQMVANRAIANAQRAHRSSKMHVRKTSI